MTPQEAKEILVRYRLNSADETDPDFAEALQMALTNPKLSQWLLDQQEFHSSVRRQIQSVEIPRDLKARILSEAPAEPTVALFPRRQFVRLAASIVVVLGLSLFWASRTPSEELNFAGWRSRMVSFALRTYQMDILTTDQNAVRKHLSERGAPADFEVTPGLAKLPVKGGGRLYWQNKPVSMVCFSLPDNETLYMFVMDENLIPGAKPSELNIATEKRLATASWSAKGKVYLMAAATDPKTLTSLGP